MAKHESEVSNVVLDNRAKIDVFVQRYIDALDQISTDHIDATRADGSAAAYEKLGNFCLKIIDGLQVDPKDGFDRLATLHVTFGDGFTSTIVPAIVPAMVQPVQPPADIQDVKPKPAEPAAPWPFPKPEPGQTLARSLSPESRALVGVLMAEPLPPILSAEDQELFDLFGGNFIRIN